MERVEVVSPVLRFFGDGPQATLSGGPFTSLVHLHGAVFTAWVLLFIAQTVLVASHRVEYTAGGRSAGLPRHPDLRHGPVRDVRHCRARAAPR